MFRPVQKIIQRPDIYVGHKMNPQIDAKLAFGVGGKVVRERNQLSLHWTRFICMCIKQNYLHCYIIYNLQCCKIAQRQ